MGSTMTPQDLIDHFGTATAASRKLGVSAPLLSMWKKRGFIPLGRQALIQIQTRGRLRCDRPELVPSDE